jgi:hypothetical protein
MYKIASTVRGLPVNAIVKPLFLKSNYCNKRKRPLDLVNGNVAKDIENYSDWLGRFPA